MRLIRWRQGMSIAALARAAGVSRPTIYEIEKRRSSPSVETMGRLAKALGVTVDALLEPERVA